MTGARVVDSLSGEEFTIRARSVVNATGPFNDALRQMDRAGTGAAPVENMVSPAGGAHVVLPDHFSPAHASRAAAAAAAAAAALASLPRELL